MNSLRLLNLVIAGVVVGILVLSFHPNELWDALKDVDARLIVPAIGLNLPVTLAAALRSSLVFRRLGHDLPASVLIPTTVVGFVAGGLTPAASGELLRAGPLQTRAGVPFESSIAAVTYERVLALYLLAIITGVLLAFTSDDRAIGLASVVVAAALVLLPWLLSSVLGQLNDHKSELGREGRLRSILRRGRDLAEQLRLLLRDLGLLLRWWSVTAAMFSMVALQYWLLARAVSDNISLDEAWLAFGASTLAGVASLIPLGLGVLDGSLAAVLNRLGTTLEQGGVVALLVRATVTLPLVLAAFACYLYLNGGLRQHVSPSQTTDLREGEPPTA